MAIVVAPYNPWRENLATQLLGNVASNYLQNQRASETAKKWGALVGLYQMQGQDQDAATINKMVEQQRLRSQEDAAVQSLLDRKTQVGLTGVPRTNVQEYIQSELSGATRQPLNPEIGQWNTPEGVAVSDALANRVIGSYTPPSEAETADWNINSYNSGMAGRIPLQFTPEGVFAKAAETPNFDFKGMINALSDPRFAPYATELMKNIDALQGIYDKRRNSNYLDMEAAAKANMAAYQGNMVARHAQDLPAWSTALSSRFAGPAEQLVEGSKSNQIGFLEGLGASLEAAAKDAVGRYGLMGDYAQANATRDAAKTHAAANVRAAEIAAKPWTDKNNLEAEAQKKLEQERAAKKVIDIVGGRSFSAANTFFNKNPQYLPTPEDMKQAQETAADVLRVTLGKENGLNLAEDISKLKPISQNPTFRKYPELVANLLVEDRDAMRRIERATAPMGVPLQGEARKTAIIRALVGTRLGNAGVITNDPAILMPVLKVLYPNEFR